MRALLSRLASRRRVLAGGAALGAWTLAGRASADPAALCFLALGDWGRDGQFEQIPVARQMGESAARLHASFVLTVGDNFYPDGVLKNDDSHWRKSFEDIYTAPSLHIPWRGTLGNHDHHTDADAQIAYSKVSSRWRMPARYYVVSETSRDGATLDLFVLDTTPMLPGSEEGDHVLAESVRLDELRTQLNWLKRALAESNADWKVVVGHHPIYSGGRHGDTPVLQESLLPILREAKTPLYLCGHDHDLQHIVRDGIHFVCTGAGSKTRPAAATKGSVFFSDHAGFTAYSVTKQMITIAFIDSKGETLHEAKVTRA